MTEPTETSSNENNDTDSRADIKAVLIVFTTAVIMAVHFVSGFTFDF